MATLILDRASERHFYDTRLPNGSSERDEVWEGVTVIRPLPNIEHQRIVNLFLKALNRVFESDESVLCLPGANVSDRIEGWNQNFREPDVLVVFAGSNATECDTHLHGGPDFLVEVLSPDDRSREKLPFYAKIGTQEALLIDRDPWKLELYQLKRGKLRLVGTANPGDGTILKSTVVPLTFELLAGKDRPKILVKHMESELEWAY